MSSSIGAYALDMVDVTTADRMHPFKSIIQRNVEVFMILKHLRRFDEIKHLNALQFLTFELNNGYGVACRCI